MIIHVETRWQWDDGRKQYVKTYDRSYEYTGPVALACGPSGDEKAAASAAQNFSKQLSSQATQVFGGASKVFQSLVNTFTPTVNAGPNQQGFSPAELSAMNSQVITGAGQAYKNERAALGNAEASVGGGNVTLPSGVNEANDANLAANAGNLTSSELNKVTQENYAVGRQDYDTAVKGLAGAPDVFNPATSAGNSAESGLQNSFEDQSKMTEQSDSWVNATIGALGGVAGTAIGGWEKNLGNQNHTGGGTGNV
jgi:hypothetical protein